MVVPVRRECGGRWKKKKVYRDVTDSLSLSLTSRAPILNGVVGDDQSERTLEKALV